MSSVIHPERDRDAGLSRVLVTGASGFVGRQFCEYLKQQGLYVRALLRGKCEGPWDDSIICDLARDCIPEQALDDIDTVFHLAGIAHAMRVPKCEEGIYWQVNVDATKRLLAEAASANVSRFIYFSSIKAMGEPGDNCVTEEWQPLPRDPYGLSKREAEKQVLAWGQATGKHAVCIRPTLIYGPQVKGNLQRWIAAIDKGRFPSIAASKNRRSMVSINDLIQAAMLAARKEQANGNVYIVSDNRAYSTRELYESICQALDKPVPTYQIPEFVFRIPAWLGDIASYLLNRPMPINSGIVERLFGSACYRAEKIREDLDWQSQLTFFDVLPEMIAAYRQPSNECK